MQWVKGLLILQRSCRVINDSGDQQLLDYDEEYHLETDNRPEVPSEDYFQIKPGICLHTSDEELLLVKKDFHSVFSNISLDAKPIDEVIKSINETIYDYFLHFCETIESASKDFAAKYKESNVRTYTEYFLKTCSAPAPKKRCIIFSLIPIFKEPVHAFSTEPPSYHTITSIIRRLKGFTSPYPLDKISIISFKPCPFLRSFVTEIIQSIWIDKCNEES